MAHEKNSDSGSETGCVMGAKTNFMRRKKGSVCVNGNQLESTRSSDSCTCQKDDFLW